MSVPDNPLAVLTLIAAPAVFTNASSVLVLGTGNRLARVVDRTRYIAQQLRNEHDRALCQMYSTQLERLEKRGQKLVGGMTFFYTAVGSFAAASLVSLLGAMLAETHYRLSFALIAALVLIASSIGFVGLSSGCTLLVQETRLALQSLRDEGRIIRDSLRELSHKP